MEGLAATPELIPAPVKVIRAKPKATYLTRICACSTGRHFERLKLPEREVRNYVAYKIWEGKSQGIRYETAWGEEIVFEPETIDEIFDGRETEFRSAEAEDWSDEVAASDRVFGNLKTRAANGKIKTIPDKRLYLRFLLIDLARRTPSAEVPNAD
ncbi:hypothetical protein [Pseudophaeobacter sp.]|uniref:hypothetical protein n=1 Tax=Pseudophaeobacter sp. TaxID=1971739 RepID=UPI0032996352